MFTLPVLYAGIIAFAIIMYVILDGFDLGLGILFPWIQSSGDRDILMNSVAPVWDGNETWMVFGAALLYGAFPIVYSTLLPQFYIPILIMLTALIFRGVAFEFRFKAHRSKPFWDMAFCLGSIFAALFQGIMLGKFIQGFGAAPMAPGVANQEWLTPFSLMAGLGVVIGYALLGATWLIIKTSGQLQKTMRFLAQRLFIIIVMFVVGVSIWSPLTSDFIYARWFSLSHFFWLSPLPIATFILAAYGFLKLRDERAEVSPFLSVIGIFILSYAGFGISTWPYLIPHSVTIWQAAASESSLKFLLVGVLLLLPLLLGYTAYAYYIFRGKVESHHGYHE